MCLCLLSTDSVMKDYEGAMLCVELTARCAEHNLNSRNICSALKENKSTHQMLGLANYEELGTQMRNVKYRKLQTENLYSTIRCL